MSDTLETSAQTILDEVAARSGLDPEIAAVAATLCAHYLVTTLTPFRVEDLRRHVDGLDELAARGRAHAEDIDAGRGPATRSRFGAGLVASLGEMAGGDAGGPVAHTMVLIGRLRKIGLRADDIQALGAAIVASVRKTAGDAYVDSMVARAKARLPLIGRYLD